MDRELVMNDHPIDDHLRNLLAKYDVPGPRYTSYPTVPAWGENAGREEYKKALKKIPVQDKLSLYFHLPFCETLCHFCGCMKVITQDHQRSREYVDTLLKEFEQVMQILKGRGKKNQVNQVHFGGGTPNFLQPEELADLMLAVRKNFELLPEAEIAIEMHPRTSTKEFCDKLKELHFNRISLGVQDFDSKVQKMINRFQTLEQTDAMVDYLRQLGFTSFNFDLVYGLPGQSEQGWKRTLEEVVRLRPGRLAVYSYAHVPWEKPAQRSFKESDLPSPEMKIRFFEMALRHFQKNGYRLIGMDHFALQDDELSQAAHEGTIHRNFMGYSTRKDDHQIGLGISSISYVGGQYFQNSKELKEYEGRVTRGDLATFRGYLLSEDDRIRRDLIQRIMCQARVKLSDFETEWSVQFWDYFRQERGRLEPFIEDRLLTITADQLQITGEGLLFLRNIAMVFDRYLKQIRETAKNPVFSRTV
ncbi:MAG: oxygen-independent coproporphyrinogen III oxidase [Deltaproteobacteria bacterium]|nr:oxygen-independent coproporphyrinogen III oxidase [Deltaproteobacteria bacterium]